MTSTPPPAAPAPEPTPKALTTRYALITVMAFITASVAGALFWLGTYSVPMAFLTGGATFGTSWVFYDRVIA
jgi:hypothetical protein